MANRILASGTESHKRMAGQRVYKQINNIKYKAPDTRLSRDALPGEIKFKQIKLTNKNTNFEVILLVRKQQNK